MPIISFSNGEGGISEISVDNTNSCNNQDIFGAIVNLNSLVNIENFNGEGIWQNEEGDTLPIPNNEFFTNPNNFYFSPYEIGTYDFTYTVQVTDTENACNEQIISESLTINVVNCTTTPCPDVPTLTALDTIFSRCEESSETIIFFLINGALPDGYTYQWYANANAEGTPIGGENSHSYTLDDIELLTAGTYTYSVIAKNDDCNDSNIINFTLTATDLPIPTINSTVSFCEQPNGTIIIESITGGTPPYNYQITNPFNDGEIVSENESATNLSEAWYAIYVNDANGCYSTELEFGGSGYIPLTTTINNAVCGQNNGSATVQTTEGATPYIYQWAGEDGTIIATSSTAENLAAGDYEVTVTDLSLIHI